MAFTDKDEADLKAVVRQSKKSPITNFVKDSPEYKRQFKEDRKEAVAKPSGELHQGDKEKNPGAYADGGMVKSKKPQYR